MQIENRCSRFFAGFNAGLVVCVDVHQLAIEADGALEQSNQGTETPGIKAAHADGHALAPPLSEG